MLCYLYPVQLKLLLKIILYFELVMFYLANISCEIFGTVLTVSGQLPGFCTSLSSLIICSHLLFAF